MNVANAIPRQLLAYYDYGTQHVRVGALIPTIAPRLRFGASLKDSELIIRHYGEAEGRGRLYDDDGETYGYEHGGSVWYELSGRELSGEMKRVSGEWKGSYGRVVWNHVGP